jgi:periplasmic divalent cation tolerance protein
MILVYVTCKDVEEAENIAREIMNKRLCACVNIFKDMQSLTFWPPKVGEIDKENEAVLLLKTVKSKYDEIEKEISKIHSYVVPCIFAIPVIAVSDSYWDWFKGEVNNEE